MYINISYVLYMRNIYVYMIVYIYKSMYMYVQGYLFEALEYLIFWNPLHHVVAVDPPMWQGTTLCRCQQGGVHAVMGES